MVDVGTGDALGDLVDICGVVNKTATFVAAVVVTVLVVVVAMTVV